MPTTSDRHDAADPYHLCRFLSAQEDVYARALAEIKSGRKTSHWMWYVFPQIAGLGFSSMSMHYAIQTLDEARAYLAHPVLGPRLIECAASVLAVEHRSAHDIFGPIDAMKLRSCATLFACVSPPKSVFHRLLDRFFAGERDPRTQQLAGVSDQVE